jgi:hypothetical protein
MYADIMQLFRQIYQLDQTRQPSFIILITAETYGTVILRLISKEEQFLAGMLGQAAIQRMT